MEERNSKKAFPKILIVIVFLIGLLIFLYPIVSGILSKHNQTCVINNYVKEVSQYTEEQLEEQIQIAKEHNETIASGREGLSHVDLLAPGKVIGYIEIPKIKVNLPIYNDISEDILRKGVGHMINSSFPVVSESTHTVLTGHRGLASSTLFTNLDKLEIEDEFVITMFGKRYTYKVDQIKVVLPEETEDLEIEKGKNLVTLITCTPYMINTHRLLVRGCFEKEEPVVYEELIQDDNIDTNITEEEENIEEIVNNRIEDKETKFICIIIITLFVMLIICLILLRKNSLKKKIVAILIFILGAIIIILPSILEKINNEKIEKDINEFEESIQKEVEQINIQNSDNIANNKFDILYEKIQKYNQELYEKGQDDILDPFLFQRSSIDLISLGFEENIIGSIYIEKLNIKLPIYLGATSENMLKGAVHLTGTSLPIGGKNTNSVIAAHRGLSTKAMFRNIQNLEIGDKVIIKNYWDTLEYEVYETKIVNPDEVNNIYIQTDQDLITLMTCHPYRKNNQRYLVYCKRI